jgi:prophage antirepressor-like protein
LGLKNTTTTIRNIPEKWRCFQKVNSSSGIQETSFVTEAGLYKIIMRSNKLITETFQEFVCEEILPSIRKTGEYKLQIIIDEKNKLAEALKQVEDDKNKLTEENYDLHLLVKRK